MCFSDLIIHVNEMLVETERAILENELRKMKGVIAPRFNKETPQLLLILYDLADINSHELLSKVKSCGYTAQIVGL